ncbi:GDSL-type esterase/lipase family protein [Streptomyces sp. NPDC021622]|uniref:GDSL-type esterase/lipase family protein n=1 Tax=Streptomyces sp. NPDC021622 TaxID=3155013 RepID=UPI0033C5C915
MKEFTRGATWWSPDGRALRADPADRDRLPADTWERAGLPAGVRLEFSACGVRAVEVTYVASPPSDTDSYRNAPPVFTLLADSGEEADTPAPARRGSGTEAVGTPSQEDAPARAQAFDTPAAPGSHVARIELPYPDGDFTLHLPETLRPALTGLRPVGGGTIEPAARRPRWLVYGDSIAEGWSASRPHLAWPALAGRALGLDTVNLGYAGAARGELASAQQLASLQADLITVAFGTNCWSRTPHSAGLLHETTRAFLTLVRQGHPGVPLLVLSPVLRPDAESVPNALGATLGELRSAVERAAGDAGAALLPGGGLLESRHLVDGVHPGDAGHCLLADAVTAALRRGQPWTAS